MSLERGVILGGLAVLAVAVFFCAIRIARGPSHFDRALAFDCLVLDVVGQILLLSTLFGTELFLDAVMVIALLGFLGTVAMAAYLEGTLGS